MSFSNFKSNNRNDRRPNHSLGLSVLPPSLSLKALGDSDAFRKTANIKKRSMQKVTPFLSFDGQAEEAARFYVSLLPDSQIDRVTRSPMDTPGGAAGAVLIVEFTLAGAPYIALNTPGFSFTEAVSFLIACADQAVTDRLWAALTADGGSEIACGWIKDYLLYLHNERKLSASILNVAVSGLRFFYRYVLDRGIAEVERALPRHKKPKQCVRVYSLTEVEMLLKQGCSDPKHRAFLMTVYSAGLRLNEACHLRLGGIESKRMMIRVAQGKGAKDRYTVLSPCLLEELRLSLQEAAAQRTPRCRQRWPSLTRRRTTPDDSVPYRRPRPRNSARQAPCPAAASNAFHPTAMCLYRWL